MKLNMSIKQLGASVGLGLAAAAVVAVPSALAHANHPAHLYNNTVNSIKIVNQSIQSIDIAAQAVGTSEIRDQSIQKIDIGANAVGTSEISDQSIQSVDIDADAVGASELRANSVGASEIVDDVQIESAVTRATGATGSFQNFAADLIYEGAAGGTSSFHAGVMGHFKGDDLTNTNVAYHAGVVGAYSVATGDDVTGPKAGVVGAVNADDAVSDDVADAAVMAVLDGGDPGEAVTANAAYGVQYINADAAAKFDYGLDLSHAAVGDIEAVTYGTADIRLAAGTTISSGAADPGTCVKGSIFLNTADGLLKVCQTTDNWTAK